MNRTQVALAAFLLVSAIAAGVWYATRSVSPPDPRLQPNEHAKEARASEIATRFQQGVVMLHAKQYDHALTAFHRVLELAPKLPEAHVNMGYTLLGLERYQAAHDFFSSAIEIKSSQANAYYGLALALEALGDLPGARGAMRTYIHLSKPDDPYIRKARAALWEWEGKDPKLTGKEIPNIGKAP